MPSSKFYRPRQAKMSAHEKAFLGDQTEKSGFTFIADDMETRHIVEKGGALEEGNYQISYSFPLSVRPHRYRLHSGKMGWYGAKGISYRLLYEYLCDWYNDGDYFIDTYFQSIFESRGVCRSFRDLTDEVSQEITEATEELYANAPRKKDGSPDMRRVQNRPFKNLRLWQNMKRKAQARKVAEAVKDDIIVCLATGMIPLRKSKVTPKTAKVRERFPEMDPDTFFYASGSLIKSLQLYVELGRSA